MVTTICTLTFKDGVKVSGMVVADSPQGSYPIQYRGDVGRLPKPLPAESDPNYLPRMFSQIAHELGAEINIEESGEYDSWAD